MKFDHIALITTNPDSSFHASKKNHIARSLEVDVVDITVHCFEPHPEGAFKGCFTSHQYVWSQIVRNNWQHSLILEDDVVFLKKIPVSHYANFLSRNNDWEIFYLGHRPIIWDTRIVQKTATPGIVEVRTNDTHAYILNLKSAQKLNEMPWENKPVDIAMREYTRKSYAIFPMRAIQSGRFFTPSFFNGMSERNSQYIRYALQKPINIFRAIGYLTFVVVGQPWIFLSSTWFCFTQKHP